MRYITDSKYAFAVGALLIVVACSSESETPNAGNKEDDSSTKIGGDDGDDTTADADDQVRTPTCTSNSECQGTWASTDGGTACCDLSTKTCFNSTEATCPAPASDDAGTDGAPPAY